MKKRLICMLILILCCGLCSGCGSSAALLPGLLQSDSSVRWEEIPAEESSYGSRYKNYFAALNEDQKKGYNNILECIYTAAEFPDKIEVPMMSGDDLTAVFEAIVYDNPEVMVFERNCSILTDGDMCYFKPAYSMTAGEFAQRLEIMYSEANRILSGIDPAADEFETELFIHDYIIRHCTYSRESEECNMTYSCIIENAAACEGYAKAAKYLLEAAGIECYTVVGDALNDSDEIESHMWNAANINGSYYYFDVTWDDPDAGDGTVSHTYLNLTQEEISLDHSNFYADFICDATQDNYFVRTNRLFDSYTWKEYNRMVALLGASEEVGTQMEDFRFTGRAAYDAAIDELANDGQAYSLARDANARYGSRIPTNNVSYSQEDRFFVISLLYR